MLYKCDLVDKNDGTICWSNCYICNQAVVDTFTIYYKGTICNACCRSINKEYKISIRLWEKESNHGTAKSELLGNSQQFTFQKPITFELVSKDRGLTGVLSLFYHNETEAKQVVKLAPHSCQILDQNSIAIAINGIKKKFTKTTNAII